MNLPCLVLYNGFSWQVTKLNENQVKLFIIGFNNQHTLTWGNAVFKEALASGKVVLEKTY